jgi:hypothetical protein
LAWLAAVVTELFCRRRLLLTVTVTFPAFPEAIASPAFMLAAEISAPSVRLMVPALTIISPPSPGPKDVVLMLLPTPEIAKVSEACTITVPPAP